MPLTERQRKLKRRQRRVRKLRRLKKDLVIAQDRASREKIIDKIRKIAPWEPLPE